ncbi:MAG TPA: AMP-binding protein [Candidatus Sulfotelmatobacter sp.]|jgi:O-succinylbenzoic acid--CoA ligase|nr:AMP-binding protein [Candidatus Sulfotelmatobacter sp.]
MNDPQRWLRQQAALRPSAEAVRRGESILSFAGLDRAADDLAATLTAAAAVHSLPPSDSMNAAVAALAAPRAGLAFHPLSAARPDPLSWRTGNAHRELPPEAVQLIISTSGSSGAPKAAMLRGSNLAAATLASSQGTALHPGDSWLCCLPLCAIGGLSILFRCLQAGARTVLMDRFDADEVECRLTLDRITHLSLVPAMLARLIERRTVPPAHLRAVLVGGAALSQNIAAQALELGWPIRPTYGMSETAAQVATCVSGHSWQPGLAGYPLPGFEVAFTPEGRLRLRGPQVMAGYANPEMAPGHGLDADGWFETGDIGWRDGSGYLWVSGRADDVFISGGVTLHPSEVEHLLVQCPDIGEVAVTARPDAAWGDVLVAVFTGPARPEHVLDWSRRNLPGSLRPRHAVGMERLPLNMAGKLDRRSLRGMALTWPSA